MTEKKRPNIYQRILSVINDAPEALRKDVTVTEGGRYNAVSHDAVTRHLRGHMVEHGIVRVIDLLESTNEPTGQTTKSGTPWFKFTGRFAVHYINADDAEDRVITHVHAEALDFGDKGPGKALSYAAKSADLKMFLIPTGEDDEERPAQADMIPAPLSSENRADLFAKAEELFGDDAEDRLFGMAEKVFRIPDGDWAMIPRAEYKRAVATLEKRAEKLRDEGNGDSD